MGASEKISEIYDQLEKSMNKKQTKDLDSRGFTFMDMNQINKVYRDSGKHLRCWLICWFLGLNVPEEALDFDDYEKLRPDQREESLWRTIEKIAINEPEASFNFLWVNLFFVSTWVILFKTNFLITKLP